MGRTADSPTSYDFKYRLRWYILGRHSSSVFVSNANTEPQSSSDENATLSMQMYSPKSSESTDLQTIEECATSVEFQNLKIENESQKKHSIVLIQFPFSSTGITTKTPIDMHMSSLKYVTGYVAYRFKDKYPFLHNHNHQNMPIRDADDWIVQVSRGGLLQRSEEFFKVTQYGETIFQAFHGNSFHKGDKVITKVANEIYNKTKEILDTPNVVLQCFVRTRTYIRIRHMNMNIKNRTDKKSLKRKKIHAPYLNV